MTTEQFEILISDWLGAPDRHDLCAQIEAACADDPALRRLWLQHQRLDRLVRQALPAPSGVDWDAAHGRFTAAVAQEAAEDQPEALSTALAQLPGVEERVDWERFRDRVSTAVERERQGGRRRRWPLVGLGIAAAVALILLRPVNVAPPTGEEAVPQGFARVQVATSPPTVPEPGHARVQVAALPADERPADDDAEPPTVADAQRPEPPLVFLMVGPPTDPVRRADVDLSSFY